ncbi:site-specific integrase [Bacteroides gallinaceum]|uniref:Site-specific integrase n=1 Tax=Bacteroides gallinaceum TaxID=1462571 RepID=A0ABT7VC73_9BACE|nr:site-specific integrase [Bacteroides gallinaceum]MDM8323889.1 site-specific integrase [Bacteroides gallinaceum]
MTSIRLKFRPSTNPAKEGTLVFQLIHKRTVRRIRSKYRIRNDEWDKKYEEIALPSPASERYSRLKIIRSNIMYELKRLKAIAEKLDCSGKDYSLEEIIQKYISGTDTGCSVFDFIRAQVAHKKQLGKIRSSETYQTTLNSFMRFREGIDLTFDMIDSELMEHYEAELRRHGLLRNTSSFYMRVLRTNYRLAVEKGLTPDRHPFKHVYCGMDKTVKRSISFAEIKKIKELDLSRKRVMDFARDMFIFSFCTRGMSFIDMAYLKKNDLKHGCLTYRRKKTGQLLVIEWTKQMQDILDKYKPNSTQYLLPIITREDGNERRQYQNQMRKINRRLKDIATSIKLPVPLSLYYSRHSWATIARCKDIPISIISEGLGHDSEITTQIYLDSIKSYEVDKANRKILKDL